MKHALPFILASGFGWLGVIASNSVLLLTADMQLGGPQPIHQLSRISRLAAVFLIAASAFLVLGIYRATA